MENNRYAQHRKEIKEISERENVDIGVACAMLRDRMGWTFEETDCIDKEITEFCRFINQMDGEEVKKYFAE